MNQLQTSGSEMEGFVGRLKELISEHRSASAFSKYVGIGGSLTRKYLDGGTPGMDKVIQIANAKNVRVQWLATGEGPRDIEAESVHPPSKVEGNIVNVQFRPGAILDKDDDAAVLLPRLSVEGSAGQGLVPARVEVEDYLAVSRNYLREVGISAQHAHVLRLSGHSMYPTLHDKDLIIIDTSKTSILDEEIYAVVLGETVLIKRIQPMFDGSILIVSDNKNGHYRDVHVPSSERHQLRIVGRVGGYLRYF